MLLTILIGIFIFLAFLILKPYIGYIIFAVLLALISFPLYKKLKSKVRNKNLAAIILILSMLLLVVIPSIFVTFELFNQVKDVFLNIQVSGIEKIPEEVYSLTGVDIKENLKLLTSDIVSYALSNIVMLTKLVTRLLVGIFIMVFTMFYLYIDGENISEKIKRMMPLHKRHQEYLISHVHNIVNALLIGIFFTALVQGVLGGLGFFLFGFNNAIFWGFVMMFLSIIPFLGPHFVYIPASLFLMYKGNFWAGIGLLLYSLIIVSNLDNIIRAKIVGFKVKIHPLIIILGVIGGIGFMGIIGMILGPLVLALFFELVKVYNLVRKKK